MRIKEVENDIEQSSEATSKKETNRKSAFLKFCISFFL